MAVVGRVQKQIGKAIAGVMLFDSFNEGRENQSGRVDAPDSRFLAKIVLDRGVVRRQPKNAVFDFLKQPHPDVEKLGGDLVVVAQIAEHETVFRKAGLRASRSRLGHEPARMIDHERTGQIDDLLAVVPPVLLGNYEPVGDQIVDEFRPRRAGETQISRLDRRRAKGEDPRSGLRGVPHQIYRDVRLQLSYQTRHLRIVLRSNVEGPVEAAHEPRANLAPVVRAEGYAEYLEPGAIVQPEKLLDAVRDRMLAKIRGQISDPDFRMPVLLAPPQRGRPPPDLVGHEALGAQLLLLEILRDREQNEGLRHRRAFPDEFFQRADACAEIVPAATRQFALKQPSDGILVVGLDGQHFFKAVYRLFMTLETLESKCQIEVRVGQTGFEGDRPAMRSNRLLQALLPLLSEADIRMRLGRFGRYRKSLLVTHDRLVEPV